MLTSGMQEMTRSHVDEFGVMFWNGMEGEMEIYGFDRGKYVMGGETIRRKPHLTVKTKR